MKHNSKLFKINNIALDRALVFLDGTGVEGRVKKALAIRKYFPTKANHIAAMNAYAALPKVKQFELQRLVRESEPLLKGFDTP